MDNFYFISHTNNMKNKSIKKVKNSKFGKPNKFDINGSYTGTSSLIADLKPIQDADDL